MSYNDHKYVNGIAKVHQCEIQSGSAKFAPRKSSYNQIYPMLRKIQILNSKNMEEETKR